MENFNLKDVLNYIISGYLWVMFLVYLPFVPLEQSILVPEGATEILLLTMASYFVGNIFRITDKWVIKVFDYLFGDLYYCALHTDRSKDKYGKLGQSNDGKHIKSLGDRVSKQINDKLKSLELFSEFKKNQFLLTETYVAMKYSSEKVARLKDLHNLFESILLPSFLLIVRFIIYLIEQIICASVNFSQIVCLGILCFAYYCASRRYLYLKANYIKEVYKTFLFV